MASARAVANEFIRLAEEDGRNFTPLQIIKLAYIAHGWMLALYHRPLIDDRIEAWKYGPVIPSLYHDLKQFGAGSVTHPLTRRGFFSDGPPLDEHEKDLVAQVYRVYGKMTGIQLSRLTHQQGTPWASTWTPESRGVPISNDLIEEHYRRLADERQHAE